MNRSSGVCQLRVDTRVRDGFAETLLFINGVDILESRRPTTHPNGTPTASGPRVFVPADPMWLLPPDSQSLIPTSVPSQAMVGLCTCHEWGCGSLWMQVRRDGDEVVWEPDPRAFRDSVDRCWRFPLVPYLDAIDAGSATMVWEPRTRRLAREMRRRRDGPFGVALGNRRHLLNVITSPVGNTICMSVAEPDGVHHYRVTVPDDQSDEDFFQRLHDFDMTHLVRVA